MAGWKYRGADVQVPFTADIPTAYRIDHHWDWVVQQVLDQVEPWRLGDHPIETARLKGYHFNRLVVPLNGRTPFWAKHRGHHARHVQLSPFVLVGLRPPPMTDLFTVELTQTPARPKLVRAYPGDYIPPLPWMLSAKDVKGGVQACQRFWRQHAYVFRPGLVVSDSRVDQAPAWFRR